MLELKKNKKIVGYPIRLFNRFRKAFIERLNQLFIL